MTGQGTEDQAGAAPGSVWRDTRAPHPCDGERQDQERETGRTALRGPAGSGAAPPALGGAPPTPAPAPQEALLLTGSGRASRAQEGRAGTGRLLVALRERRRPRRTEAWRDEGVPPQGGVGG